MEDDETRYFSFWEMLAISVAPAVIEHLLAPLLFRQVDPDDVREPEATPERKRKRSAAAARGFASFVAHEKAPTK